MSILESQPGMKELLELLDECSDRWSHIGSSLNVDPDFLSSLQSKPCDDQQKLNDVIKDWHECEGDFSYKPVTWQAIIDALKTKQVRRPRVARKIKEYLQEKYKTRID